MPSHPAASPVWDAHHLRLAIDAAGVALWSWEVEDDAFAMDDHGYGLWGLPVSTSVKFEEMSARIHPADRDRVGAAFTATRSIVGPYEIDFRIILNDEVRWISARGQGGDAKDGGGTMFGVFLDVTGRKQAEEGHELLAGEMSHRVKNLLTIATALTAISSRSAVTTQDMAQELTNRLMALGRAHDLVRPLPGGEVGGALLGDLVTILLAPYDDLGAFSGRIRVSVPRMSVGERGATTLALVLHELATNSMKYGALCVAEGTLDVSCVIDEREVVMTWTESGGPAVEASATAGFGGNMLERSMTRQLGGSVERDWRPDGLIVTLRMNRDQLAV